MDRLMNYQREHGGISQFKKIEWFYREVVKATLSDGMMVTRCFSQEYGRQALTPEQRQLPLHPRQYPDSPYQTWGMPGLC